MNQCWGFEVEQRRVLLHTPAGLEGVTEALSALVNEDLGGKAPVVERFAALWKAIEAKDPEAVNRTSGNATGQIVRGDEVALVSLHDQWPTVSLPIRDFVAFLDQYLTFLRSRASDGT
jgi:hypothetical protein